MDREITNARSMFERADDEYRAASEELEKIDSVSLVHADREKIRKLQAAWGEQRNTYLKELNRLLDEKDLREAKELADARQFWFRRFHTSLAIANGGAFAAVGSKAFDSGLAAAAKVSAAHALICFAVGLMIAGIIPVALFRPHERFAWGLAGVSGLVFAVGLSTAVSAFVENAQLMWPWQLG